MKPSPQDAYKNPLAVEIYDGEVIITGPGRIDVALTAQAAAQTAQRLAAAAAAAQQTESSRNPVQPVTSASQASVLED